MSPEAIAYMKEKYGIDEYNRRRESLEKSVKKSLQRYLNLSVTALKKFRIGIIKPLM